MVFKKSKKFAKRIPMDVFKIPKSIESQLSEKNKNFIPNGAR